MQSLLIINWFPAKENRNMWEITFRKIHEKSREVILRLWSQFNMYMLHIYYTTIQHEWTELRGWCINIGSGYIKPNSLGPTPALPNLILFGGGCMLRSGLTTWSSHISVYNLFLYNTLLYSTIKFKYWLWALQNNCKTCISNQHKIWCCHYLVIPKIKL